MHAWLRAYAWVWAVTLLAAGATALIVPLGTPVRELLKLKLSANPEPSIAQVLILAAHNIPVCGWPLLLPVLGAQHRGWSRTLADVGVFMNTGVNAILVGFALGAYRTRLLPYVPQLPVEWGALALGAAGWILASDRDRPTCQLRVWWELGWMLTAAAVIETLAVPHR